jgi:hypothetical protein
MAAKNCNHLNQDFPFDGLGMAFSGWDGELLELCSHPGESQGNSSRLARPPALTRHAHTAYSVIEEFVEGSIQSRVYPLSGNSLLYFMNGTPEHQVHNLKVSLDGLLCEPVKLTFA